MKFARLTSIAAIALFAVLALPATMLAQTQTLTVLHNFTGAPDGIYPNGALLLDQSGNLYGTTSQGGTGGIGTVFKVDSSGSESVVYSFSGSSGGAHPLGGLVRDAAGNLYGTTSDSAYCQAPNGCGNVFRLDAGGTMTVLHRFGNASDGANPTGPLTLDSAGNLFGTTFTGGGTGCKRYSGGKLVVVGCGTVFKVDANGHESILHAFVTTDGAYPSAGLVQDTAGNLFGTAYQGGLQNCKFSTLGCGTVFKIDTAAQFSVLYPFQGSELGPDGAYPQGRLALDPAGNLYGTTASGGLPQKACPSVPQGSSCGTIFQLPPAGKESVLYSFKGLLGTPGGPTAGLVRDAAGNLYGFAGGTVFKLDSTGKESDLFTFTGYPDDAASGDLVQDANGNLYGAIPHGVNGFGAVFKVTTAPDFAVTASALTPGTVSPGQPSTSKVDVTGLSGFSGAVSLTCSVQPSPTLAPTCSINPSSVNPGTPATLTVSTTGPTAGALPSSSGSGLFYAVCLPLIGLLATGVGFRSPRNGKGKMVAVALACMIFAGLVSQVACGGGTSSTGGGSTPAGTYTITVTGTDVSGSLKHATTTPLMVQ